MKTARLTTRSTSNGAEASRDEVVLMCSPEEAQILCKALDVYLTEVKKYMKSECKKQLSSKATTAVHMYHELAWNYREYFEK